MKKLLVATKNKHKLEEISAILTDLNIEVVSAYDVIDTDLDVEETGDTFEANSRLKSEEISKLTGYHVIADDSGLEVDFLEGAPGVYSARYAGVGATDEDNNDKLLKALDGVDSKERTGRFVCVISFSRKGKTISSFRGTCEGAIGVERVGDHGFGYDPLFVLPDGRSMAELPAAEKNSLSHRSHALKLLKGFLVTYLNERN